MVFPLQPVLVHLLVDVDDVTLLQGQLPGGQSKDSSKLRSSPSFFSEPVQNTQSPLHTLGTPTSGLHPPPECRASSRGQGWGEKGTYLGDCAWKSNLSLAAFLCAGGEDTGATRV